MKIKGLFTTIILCTIVTMFFVIDFLYQKNYDDATSAYYVYLNGEKIGMIEDEATLYDLINNEQEEIRKLYDVDSVYPPDGFDLVNVNTYSKNFSSINEIYEKIESLDNFTIKGYIITVKPNEEGKEPFAINVLDYEVFEEAINQFILSFIDEEDLNKYLEGNRTITEIGSIISSMYFNETITVKEGYISVNDTIYSSSEELAQYLLFGADAQMEEYTVKLGDTIASISEDHQMSTQEFIIANPSYRNEKTLLEVGATVNTTYIKPVLTLTYEIYQIEENITEFTKTEVVDKTKPYNFSEITTPGVNGISIVHTSYQVINGEPSSEAKTISTDLIREMVEQVTTVGQKRPAVSGQYVTIGGSWGYPTNYPYVVTSPYGWRSGEMHNGVDISGTGFRSPIYAVGDGVVVEVRQRTKDGLYIILQHEGNVYTQYAHLHAQLVKEGQTVTRGQIIGEMGSTGYSSGVHVHFGVSIGYPYSGSYYFVNPNSLIKIQ